MAKKYKVTKDFGWTKVQSAIKNDIITDFMEFLTEKYGVAKQIRVKSGDNESNELSFLAAEVEEDGATYPTYVAFNPAVKSWKSRPYGKKTRPAFDFEAVAERFTAYVAETEQKEADAKRKKAEKIAKDTARREAEKEAAKQEQD